MSAFHIGGILTISFLILILFYVSIEKLSFWIELVNLNEYAEKAYFSVYPGFPCISWLDFLGSIVTCTSYRQNALFPKLWLESLISCTILRFGGTTLTGLLLGQTPSWILSSTAFPALLLAWMLTFFSPYDIHWNYIIKFPLILTLCEIGAAISSGHAVTSWGMDKALVNIFHSNSNRIRDSFLTCLLCGTLSACGGGLVGDFLGFFRSPSFTITVPPKVFSFLNSTSITSSNPSSVLTRSFLFALIYYLLLNPSKYFPWVPPVTVPSARCVIGILQLLHFFTMSIYPGKLDLYGYVASLLFSYQLNPIVTPPSKANVNSNSKNNNNDNHNDNNNLIVNPNENNATSSELKSPGRKKKGKKVE